MGRREDAFCTVHVGPSFPNIHPTSEAPPGFYCLVAVQEDTFLRSQQ